MTVTTTHRIYVLNAAQEAKSGIDSSTSPNEIKKFQNWVEAKKPEYAAKEGTGRYGVFDRLTGNAWKKFGQEYQNQSKSSAPTDKKLKRVGNTVPDDQPAKTTQKDGKKNLVEKFKSMPMGAKVGIIAGIVGLGVILTVGIAAATKKD